MSIVTIVGAGQMASALSFPLFENGHEVRLVGTPLDREIISELQEKNWHPTLKRNLHQGIHYFQIEALKRALEGCDVVLCGVSSFGVQWFAEEIIPVLPGDVPVIAVTKGMIKDGNGTLISYPEYWNACPGGEQLSINGIGGPCTSYELADHDHSEVAFCGHDIEILRKLKKVFSTSYYHINLSTDVRGVECAVALKNAYALGVSLTIGLCEQREGKGVLHYNSQAAAFMESVYEMKRLLRIFGGGEENLIYGAGDLYVTIFGGRTRKIGTLLGNGKKFDEAMKELNGVTLESIVIAGRVADVLRHMGERGEIDEDEFPLLFHVDEVIRKDKDPELPWEKFVRETETENE